MSDLAGAVLEPAPASGARGSPTSGSTFEGTETLRLLEISRRAGFNALTSRRALTWHYLDERLSQRLLMRGGAIAPVSVIHFKKNRVPLVRIESENVLQYY
jgi:hypothetical protein